LKIYFEKECKLEAIYFYTGRVGGNDKQTSFIKKLEKLGYKVIAKEVKHIKISRNTYEWKGNLDAELIIDALKHADDFDTFILMSGDSDFAPLLDELKLKRKRVIVMSSKHHVSLELIERAKYINIKKLKEQIMFPK